MGDKSKRGASRKKKKNPAKYALKRKLVEQKDTQHASDASLSGSSSAKKLCRTQCNTNTDIAVDKTSLGNSIVNMDLLVSFIQDFKCCQPVGGGRSCGGSFTVSVKNLGGLAQQISTDCGGCEHHSDKDLTHRVAGSRSYEVNRRFVAAVTSIGGHNAECNRLAAYLDIPRPCTPNAYNNHLQYIANSAQDTTAKSMQDAAREAKEHMKSKDIRVSVDGTWQRRGFSSKNGVVTVLSVLGKHEGSKVIDTEVLTTFCAACMQHNNDATKLSTIANHTDCSVNHEGSSGAMEGNGALKIFNRSENKHGLRYTQYLGDGDSKAYKTVVDNKVYGDTAIEKLECTGHIQKRMGKALMTVVSDHKSKPFVVDKGGKTLSKPVANKSRGEKKYTGIGGKDRLTKDAIKKIQGHYGAAIRENDTVDAMKVAIWAIFYHRKGDHSRCPQWCASHTGDKAKADKHRLPAFVCDAIKPVFERLSSDALLAKCEHGGTQNANEAYHHLLWQRCPKEKFCGATRIKLAVAISTLCFNDGESGVLSAFQRMGLSTSPNHWNYAQQADATRVQKSNQAVRDDVMAKRRKGRSIVDNTAYEAGAF